MRIQSVKLLIFGVSIVAGGALGARFYWFLQNKLELTTPSPPTWRKHLRELEKEIRNERNGLERKKKTEKFARERNLRREDMAISWWWKNYRKGFLEEKNTVQVEQDPWSDYEELVKVNLSGTARPIVKEPEKAPDRPTGPLPYDEFSKVKVVTAWDIITDDEKTAYVWVEHVVSPPRAHLGDAGLKEQYDYTVGQKLIPMPEVSIESIDTEKGEVVFRMPKHKNSQDPEYKEYKGTEEDSQLKPVQYRAMASMDVPNGPGPNGKAKDENERPGENGREDDSTVFINPANNKPFPKTTTNVPGTRMWDVGVEDMAELEKGDFEDRIRRDVSVKSYNQGGITGVRIDKLRQGSLFSGKGLMKGDVVSKIGNKKIRTLAEATRYFREHGTAGSYNLSVYRNGRPISLMYRVPRR